LQLISAIPWKISFFPLSALSHSFKIINEHSLINVQVNRYSYSYFRRNFTEYGRISAADIKIKYGSFKCRKGTIDGRVRLVSFELDNFDTGCKH